MSINLLAADVGSIVTLIFLVIGIISAIANQSKQNQNAKAGNNAGRGAGGRDAVRDEIESFLNEAKRQKRNQAGGDDEALEIVEIEEPYEIMEIEEFETPSPQPTARRRREQRARSRQQQRQSRRQQQPQQRQRKKERQRIADRHVGSDNLGQGVSQHVKSHIGESSVTEDHLAHSVDDSVKQHLGEFTAAKSSRKRSGAANALAKMMQDKDSVRNAFILQEIIGRPISTREKE